MSLRDATDVRGPAGAEVYEGGANVNVETESKVMAATPLDLVRLRTMIPNNLYWRLDAPTADEALASARAEEDRGWNELFGKVQSNTASMEEIYSYYEHKRRLSEDYAEFSSLVLSEFGNTLSERDRGLYELGITMHRARLAEVPRQLEDALSRKEKHDARREEWIRTRGKQ